MYRGVEYSLAIPRVGHAQRHSEGGLVRTTFVALLLILPSAGCANSPGKNWPSAWQETEPSFLPFAAGAAAALGPLAAEAPSTDRQGTMAAGGAVGFTLEPETFLMTGHGDYFLNDIVAVGGVLQLGFGDDRLIFAPTANVKAVFDLPDLERLRPFAQGGLGIGYLQKDRRNDDDDDVGFLLNFGFGADYFLNERFSLGNSVLFNIMPEEVLGERFFFSWQFVSASLRF